MTNQNEAGTIAGSVLRGADGALYFIPNSVLDVCRLSETTATQVGEAFAEGEEVSGFGFQVANLSPLGQLALPVGPVVPRGAHRRAGTTRLPREIGRAHV